MPRDAGADQEIELNPRDRAMLRGVAGGGAEMSHSREPDLFLDGLPCCDQTTAHKLAHLGLVAPTRDGRPGEHVPATLTAKGRAALEHTPAVPA